MRIMYIKIPCVPDMFPISIARDEVVTNQQYIDVLVCNS
jgi:hypothetical protein